MSLLGRRLSLLATVCLSPGHHTSLFSPSPPAPPLLCASTQLTSPFFIPHTEYNSGTMTIACAVTGTTTASCKQTVIRPVDDMDPNAGGESGGGDEQENFSTVSGTDTGLVTEALETTLAASDMTFYPVTITAGSLKSGGGGGGEGSSTTSGTAGSSAAGASGSGESANASGGGGSGSSGGAGQLVLEVVSVVAAGSIALLMVML